MTFLDNTVTAVATRAVVLGGVYGTAWIAMGKDNAGRLLSYIPSLGGDLAELALKSLVEAHFISPVTSEAVTKARYIGTVSTALIALWKGPALFAGCTERIFNDFSFTNMLKQPFSVKPHWHTHPHRILLTKQQTAAIGAITVVAAALVAGSDRTAWALEQLREVPTHAADYVLNTLNITQDSWFSSVSTPTWAKWVVSIPLVAGGWWAVNTVASGVLWGVNRVLKGAQTPTGGLNWYEQYFQSQASRRKEGAEASQREKELTEKYQREKDRGDGYQAICGKLIDNIAPALQGKLDGLSEKVLEFAQKKNAEDKQGD